LAGDAPAITETAFVRDGLARLAGGTATAPTESAPVRLITPARPDRRSRTAPSIAVLRGR